jgi:Glucodextranase, domain B/PASTA domain
MPGLRIAATVTALLALAIAPAAARATVTGTQITGWTSQNPATPPNNPYLISLDNPPNPTTLTVTGTAPGATNSDHVDIVCYFGAPPSVAKLNTSPVAINNGTFTTGPLPLKAIAGHACRLRAIPAGTETGAEIDTFPAQQIAVSEAALPIAISSGTNAGAPFNFYVNDVTFTGFAVWSAAGTPVQSLPSPYTNACGGPQAAPIDPAFDIGNFAIDCAGSLLSDDLRAFGGRSEVQVDGRNAYDPAAAQGLFTSGSPVSQNLAGFPKTLSASVEWDPTTGLISSHATEPWVVCDGPNAEDPTPSSCPSFSNSGVHLERTTTTSDGGRVVTMTDTWFSTDGKAHALDLLYDDAIGVVTVPPDGVPGYEFPGQTTFSQYAAGNTLPGPSSAPGTILVRTNVAASDGDPDEAVGAITFGNAPSAFAFTANDDFEGHNVLVVPAGGSTSLSYVYSVGYSVADVSRLALTAQDRFEPPSVVIGSPAGGTTTSSATTTLSGIASAGSGIASLAVDGQSVPVASNGTWTAQVPLSPGTNTITAAVTDDAGASAQSQVAVVYNPPPPPLPPPAKCKVPKTKGMKLNAAEKTLRRAHCRVGKIKRKNSRTVRGGHVTRTTPRAGRILKAGTKIELFVSKGP